MEHPGTRRQFEVTWRERTLKENPSLTRADYNRVYPMRSRTMQWVRACEDFIREGGTLTRLEADSLHAEGVAVLRLAHGYERALPEGYLPPDVRAWNREHESTMRAARRGT